MTNDTQTQAGSYQISLCADFGSQILEPKYNLADFGTKIIAEPKYNQEHMREGALTVGIIAQFAEHDLI